MLYLAVWAVLATFTAIVLTLRLLSQNTSYGKIIVIETDESKTFLLELDGDPDELENYDVVCFTVVNKKDQE
jgi:hypothetical protein